MGGIYRGFIVVLSFERGVGGAWVSGDLADRQIQCICQQLY